MAVAIQWRGMPSNYIGLEREITVLDDIKAICLHDGSTVGGIPSIMNVDDSISTNNIKNGAVTIDKLSAEAQAELGISYTRADIDNKDNVVLNTAIAYHADKFSEKLDNPVSKTANHLLGWDAGLNLVSIDPSTVGATATQPSWHGLTVRDGVLEYYTGQESFSLSGISGFEMATLSSSYRIDSSGHLILEI